MTITARMLKPEEDGIGGYLAQPDGVATRPGILMAHHAHGVTADYKIDAYRLAQLGFNVLVPSLFNMFGIPGTTHIGQGADLQAKHSDPEFLGKLDTGPSTRRATRLDLANWLVSTRNPLTARAYVNFFGDRDVARSADGSET